MSSKTHMIIIFKRAVSMMQNHALFLAYVSEEAADELVIKKRYIVIYQIKKNNVYVDYIVDQDYGWML